MTSSTDRRRSRCRNRGRLVVPWEDVLERTCGGARVCMQACVSDIQSTVCLGIGRTLDGSGQAMPTSYCTSGLRTLYVCMCVCTYSVLPSGDARYGQERGSSRASCVVGFSVCPSTKGHRTRSYPPHQHQLSVAIDKHYGVVGTRSIPTQPRASSALPGTDLSAAAAWAS